MDVGNGRTFERWGVAEYLIRSQDCFVVHSVSSAAKLVSPFLPPAMATSVALISQRMIHVRTVQVSCFPFIDLCQLPFYNYNTIGRPGWSIANLTVRFSWETNAENSAHEESPDVLLERGISQHTRFLDLRGGAPLSACDLWLNW
jgi:hypothetical protein